MKLSMEAKTYITESSGRLTLDITSQQGHGTGECGGFSMMLKVQRSEGLFLLLLARAVRRYPGFITDTIPSESEAES